MDMSETKTFETGRLRAFLGTIICGALAVALWAFDASFLDEDMQFESFMFLLTAVMFMLMGLLCLVIVLLPHRAVTLTKEGFYYDKYPNMLVEWKDVANTSYTHFSMAMKVTLKDNYHPILVAQAEGKVSPGDGHAGYITVWLPAFLPTPHEFFSKFSDALNNYQGEGEIREFEALVEARVQEVARAEGRPVEEVRAEFEELELEYFDD